MLLARQPGRGADRQTPPVAEAGSIHPQGYNRATLYPRVSLVRLLLALRLSWPVSSNTSENQGRLAGKTTVPVRLRLKDRRWCTAFDFVASSHAVNGAVNQQRVFCPPRRAESFRRSRTTGHEVVQAVSRVVRKRFLI